MVDAPDLVTPVDLARMAYDSADYARERSECVALHLERGNLDRARQFLRELRRQTNALNAAVLALEGILATEGIEVRS